MIDPSLIISVINAGLIVVSIVVGLFKKVRIHSECFKCCGCFEVDTEPVHSCSSSSSDSSDSEKKPIT